MSDDFMGGGGGKSVPFNVIGDTVTGVIISKPEKRESRDDDGQPRTYSSGDIRYVWVVGIATDLRDPDDPFDEGDRSLWLKWHSLTAVQKAVRAAGAKTLEVGGTLTLTLTGFGPKTKASWNPPKLYSAVYSPPPNGFMDSAPQETAPATQTALPPTPSAPSASQSVLDRLKGQHGRNDVARGSVADHHSSGKPPF